MKKEEVMELLDTLNGATKIGKTNDGSRIHIRYRKFTKDTALSVQERERAKDLKIKDDRYTGRLDRVYKSGSGDTIMTMLVELERDHKYRSFNLDKGELITIAVLGN
jgi:hypothetical protein